jgi:RimJ/RimL family protein N-acetyltransferase
LLALLTNVAVREQRRLVEMRTYESVPAGVAFLQRLDAKMCRAEHVNQLNLCDLKRDLVCQWMERAHERATDFELLTIEGRYPDDMLVAITELHHVMNTMPRDNLDIEDWQTTPEQTRDFEQSLFARGNERWAMFVRHKPSGELAGFTETVWNASRPEILEQWGTGVLPEYRNHGLGRWLKAGMIDKALRERLHVKRIRTGNADSNAPMLKINYELGFKPYQASQTWQVETEKVLQYVGRAA